MKFSTVLVAASTLGSAALAAPVSSNGDAVGAGLFYYGGDEKVRGEVFYEQGAVD